MKILYIFNALANKAGTERILTDKITYLAANPKYEVSIVTNEQGITHLLSLYRTM